MSALGARSPAKEQKVNPILLVVLGILVVVGLVYLVVALGGGEETPPPAARPTASPTATAGASPAPTASPDVSPSPSPAAPPGTFELFESKDPFRPLVVAEAPGEAPAPGAGPGPGPGAPGATPSPGAGAGGAPAPGGGTVVEVLDVFDDEGTTRVQVKVGSTVHTVATGETFASTFKVLSISGTCATMLNGDDKFTLCEGEQVVK